MNQDIKKEWVADLRSGEIHKTKNQLRRGNRMCALGVLCNVHAKHHPEIAAQQKLKSRYMGESEILPKEVAEWAGIKQQPKVYFDNVSREVSYINDNLGLSFKQIADLIEEQL